ncbi:UNVERIFIED_CONTAM: hypothetical protein GTU68_062856 [Idotea baltica]|nr:hypothetical protein [Idotea baltica]
MKTYIIDGTRTPIGKFRGSLSTIRTDDLAAHPIRSLMNRYPNLPMEMIDDVIFGCANQAGEDNRNIARMALLLAGLPWTVPGETVNRLCASGMSATIQAHRAVQAGDGHLFISGGVENMTRGPWVVSKSARPFGSDAQMYGTHSMGQTAENLAEKYNISRAEQDQFALWSQQKAADARDTGRLAQEITPINIPQRKRDPIVFDTDEFIKDFTTLEGLSKLRAVFKAEGGSVTAGNASGLNDGAGALLVASEKACSEYDLKPLARIVSSGVAGVEPRIMGIGPVYASQKALDKAGLTLDQIDIIEINEAFSAQAIACFKQWGISLDDPRINPNGGAIAIGHPLGMSGARILHTAGLELRRRDKKYALVTMCVGVGQGYAVVLEAQ